MQSRSIDPALIANEKRRVIARERVLEWFDPIPGDSMPLVGCSGCVSVMDVNISVGLVAGGTSVISSTGKPGRHDPERAPTPPRPRECFEPVGDETRLERSDRVVSITTYPHRKGPTAGFNTCHGRLGTSRKGGGGAQDLQNTKASGTS